VVIGLTPVMAACVSNVTSGASSAIRKYRIFIVASRLLVEVLRAARCSTAPVRAQDAPRLATGASPAVLICCVCAGAFSRSYFAPPDS
jgi:hypothetical protein